MDEFRYLFEGSGMDIICISETWFHCHTPDSAYELNGYRIFRSDRFSHGGGVAIYIKTPIQCKLVCRNVDYGDNTLRTEYLFLELSSHERKLLLGTVYRPNRNVDIEPLIDNLSSLTLGYSDVVLAGDFNSNILADSRLMLDMSALGLSLVNRILPTHFTPTSATLLDLFFTDSISRVQLFDQLSASVFSAHDLIFLAYDYRISLEDRKIHFRDFRNIDLFSLEAELGSIPWSMVFTMPNVNEQVSFLHNNIQRLYHEYVLLRTKTLSTTKKPWFSNDIMGLINERNNAYERWKRFRTPELRQIFRNRRSEVNFKIRVAKREYYRDKFSTALSSKRKWREIRDMGVLDKGNMTESDIDVEQLSFEFANIQMPSSNIRYYDPTNTGGTLNLDDVGFQFANVTPEEVVRSFHSIKSNSIGSDEIHPRFLKIILNQLIGYITHLFNTILTTSEFPLMWKNAKIIPVPKPDKSFRPIAILPYLSKAFERLVHAQINKYLNENSLLTSRQSGFRSGHGCITALVDVAEELRSKLDKNMVSFLVLLDHSKAFDTVDHDILCHKLRNIFSFSSSAVKLIRSYLCDRSQAVYSGNMKSASCFLKRGVPQGSILGPLLYTIYSNDLPSHITYCKTQMYADDVQLYISCAKTGIRNCISNLNYDLNSIYKWASANGLSLNARKSKAIVIGRTSYMTDSLPLLVLGNSPIEIVQNAKNLGIIFNSQLTWTDHINLICGRTYGMLRNLWRFQFYTPLNIRMLLAKTYLIPTLLYGCELYMGLDSVSRRKLNVTFNNIARYIYGRSRSSTISHYSRQIYNMSLDNFLKYRTLIFLHKIIYKRQPFYLYDRLQFSRSNRGYRINTIRYDRQISERHFYINAIRLWNQLPSDIQLKSNAMQFMTATMAHFSN